MQQRVRYLGTLAPNDERFEAIQRLDSHCFHAADPALERTARTHWWVVGPATAPLAYASVRPSTRWADCVYFARAGVAPEARGLGLQRRLVRARLRWAARNAYMYAITDTLASNVQSANNLVREGFRVFWPHPANLWAGTGALYLIRAVGQPRR